MKLEIGYGLDVYGIVSETPKGLVTIGRTAEGLRQLDTILRNMRAPGQSDHDLLVALAQQLDGRLWAREIGTSSR